MIEQNVSREDKGVSYETDKEELRRFILNQIKKMIWYRPLR